MTRFFSILLFVILLGGFSYGQSADKANNKIKGIYVYQFAKNVDWPKEYKTGDFVIGVYGDRDLYEQLSASYTGKSIGSQVIKVKFFDAVSGISTCHILYIANKYSSKVNELSKKFTKNKTLIVSNDSGSLEDGAVINFLVKDSKIAFEISKKNAGKSNLVIGQTLTKLATNVL